ncbi:hypothetical protein BKH46_08625 [Helicobacter sp. 12S02634-8]|uniref:hypothetical protein n=1 Tax=Helicobacter sp. 12S02634-8 TaxID=1476199 RepID=UPI000BA63D7C|nr:hypothetical protein [Helicobacter sp. 12S02634-8]PAF46191.1 hypothetical protein BKH46_08625 [Helicobacter sp. 12S02634-8]
MEAQEIALMTQSKSPQCTLDEILDAVERVNPRLQLLQEGHSAIYYDENISKEYNLLLQPDGKCYLIKYEDTLQKSQILRELTQEEYAKLDVIKGRDY